ncbi:MAG: hypothetical protein FJ146_16605 [Deltaproteobacteria bacterium]|nr:hypothetical protein [Deltaproteobacteria bacterium]
MELPDGIRYGRWLATLLLAIGLVLIITSSKYHFTTFLAALIVHVVLIVFVATVLMTKMQSGIRDDQAQQPTIFRSCGRNLILMMRSFPFFWRGNEFWHSIIVVSLYSPRVGFLYFFVAWSSETLFLLPLMNYLHLSPSEAAHLKMKHRVEFDLCRGKYFRLKQIEKFLLVSVLLVLSIVPIYLVIEVDREDRILILFVFMLAVHWLCMYRFLCIGRDFALYAQTLRHQELQHT